MNNSTTCKDTPESRKTASQKTLVLRLTEERKRQVRTYLAASGATVQAFLERCLELGLAEIKMEKN
jgi:hypothetical protein